MVCELATRTKAAGAFRVPERKNLKTDFVSLAQAAQRHAGDRPSAGELRKMARSSSVVEKRKEVAAGAHKTKSRVYDISGA